MHQVVRGRYYLPIDTWLLSFIKVAVCLYVVAKAGKPVMELIGLALDNIAKVIALVKECKATKR